VLELIETRVSVVGAYAEPAALDSLVVPSRSVPLRVAPDEMLFVAHAEEAPAVVRQVSDRLGVLDPEGLAIDLSDGWFALTLEGEGAREVFAHVSELHLPAGGFIQGKVGGLPAKLLVEADRIQVMVASMWSDHVVGRLSAEAPDAHHSTADFEPSGWPT
jgi:sarcosine oxidase gamma subunit